ncbi:MAG: hypothetical protein PHQ12_01690 [Chthoniobacteraceae bacterium]|nr:hypothetical protein [Chthoniobacteraceae bacterium]
MGNALGALEERVREGIARQGRYFVGAPAELARLGDVKAAEAFARWHGWMFVCHLDGAAYEFFETRPGQQLY